jgi:hypothetical protein
MSDIESNNPAPLATIGDGFDGYIDRVEGDDGPPPQGIIRGSLLKFSATAEWERRDGEVIGPEVKLIVTDIVRAVLKWDADKTKRPEATIIPAGQAFPDVTAMNDAVPKKQWRQGPAGLQGPYQTQQAVVMIEPRSMEGFTFCTSSIGGFICVRELVDKVKTMRRYRGPVSPVVTLGDAPMRTRFGERRRPSIHIVDWVRMDGGGGGDEAVPVLPPPSQGPPLAPATDSAAAPIIEAEAVEAEPAKAAKAAKKPRPSRRIGALDVAAPLTPMAPVTIDEETGDEISF